MGMRKLMISRSITRRETLSLEKYLSEIGKYKLLQNQDEVKLAKRIKQGDIKALNELVNSNLRFVISVAKQYQKFGIALSDLINEGNVGLIKAARRFDETKGFKFITYAVWWIRQALLQAIADQSKLIHYPLNKIGLNLRIQHDSEKLSQIYEREPTAQELAQSLKLNVDEVEFAMRAMTDHVSLDQSGEDNENYCSYDTIADENCTRVDDRLEHAESLREDVKLIMSQLTERQREVISDFFGLDQHPSMSLDEIAAKLHLSKERIRQIRDKAIMKLRNSKLCCRKLHTYLGR